MVISFILSHGCQYSIARMCRLLGISRSGYYDSVSVCSSGVDLVRARLIELFWYHKRRYGSRRLVVALSREGHYVGRGQVMRMMREEGLVALQPRSFVPRTTQSHPYLRRSPNLLLESGLPSALDRVWVGDITYLPLLGGGWAYLAVWMDLYSRYIVGWRVRAHMKARLVLKAFEQGIYHRSPAKGLVVHSDGGGQYGAKKFRALLSRKGFVQSMTRKDNHYDNAHVESLFGRLKTELLSEGRFKSVEEAQSRCFEYIELYYNPIRLHSSLGYQSPHEFEAKIKK